MTAHRTSVLLAVACMVAVVPATVSAQQRNYPGDWQLTQYWIADEATHLGDARSSATIIDREGAVLAYTSPSYLADLTMEGTGRTWDGRLLNWDQRVNGTARFVVVDTDRYPYGIGVMGYGLVPYRSLAVDRRFLPIGHTVEIADLAGMPMPDGHVHDGCFVATDGGGAINGHHIDLFLPDGTAWRELGRAGYLPSRVRSVIVDAPRCASALRYAVVPSPWDPSPVRVAPAR